MNVQERVIRQGIRKDADFVGRLVRDMSSPTAASFAHVIALCMAPYLSLFAHESYRKLQRVDPALSSLLSHDIETIAARSRHSLKLFEDTHRGVIGQLEYFQNELLPAHRRRFFGTHRFDPLRFLKTDLGRFSYGGRLVTTTHSATFHMGIEPERLLKNKAGLDIRSIYEEYGGYFARLGARMDATGSTFVGSLDPKLFNQDSDDVQSGRYYAEIFNGAATPELNALLSVFQGMIDFVDRVVVIAPVAEYTPWKIRFLTLYQILGSLKVLRAERAHELTAVSMQYIDRILTSPEARLIMQPSAKPFRNTLMHYNVAPRLDLTRIDLTDQLFGLVSVYYAGHTTTTFSKMVDDCITATALALNEWAQPA